MQFKALISIASLVLAGSMTNAHEYVTSPCIRGSPESACQGKTGAPDYDSASPIASFGVASMPLCRYPKGQTVSTFKAGETVTLKMNNGAPHKGGHCEVSISLNDKDFVSIRTILTKCMVDADGLNLKAVIPQSAPTLAKATLAWTWINAEGNREFYMNCIDISIEGVAGGSIVGPFIVLANYPVNGPPVMIGEFEYGADPRLDLYNNRPQVTLTANGIASGGSPPVAIPITTTSATTKTTAVTTPPPTTTATTPIASSTATPASTTSKTKDTVTPKPTPTTTRPHLMATSTSTATFTSNPRNHHQHQYQHQHRRQH